MDKNYPIPHRLNIFIFFVALALNWWFLWLASHGEWWGVALGVVGFALFHNTIFALMHEGVHGVFSANTRTNAFFSHLCAATFPTSFSMQRVAHLGHHNRNRTDVEIFDYYLPHESKLKRNLILYLGNLGGLYWFCIPFINLLILVAPRFSRSDWFIQKPARALGFEPFLKEIALIPIKRLWLESFLALSYQIFIFVVLDLNWQGWLMAHWAFSLHWSSLQYVDHAWTPRDVVNGAWNLKVHPLSRLIALNYHCHLVHHRFASIPWIYLPKLVNKKEYSPTFWKIYFSLYKGVKPAPPMIESS